jgi:hypothetical protein
MLELYAYFHVSCVPHLTQAHCQLFFPLSPPYMGLIVLFRLLILLCALNDVIKRLNACRICMTRIQMAGWPKVVLPGNRTINIRNRAQRSSFQKNPDTYISARFKFPDY